MDKVSLIDRKIIVDDVLNLCLDVSKFGYKLRGVKFLVDTGKEIKVYQCKTYDFCISSKDGRHHSCSLISEVDE